MTTSIHTETTQQITAEDMMQLALSRTNPGDEDEIAKLTGILAQMSFDREFSESQTDVAEVLLKRMGWEELVDLGGIYPPMDYAVVKGGEVAAFLYTTVRSDTYNDEVPLPLNIYMVLRNLTEKTGMKAIVGIGTPTGVLSTELKDGEKTGRVTLQQQGLDAKSPFPGPVVMIPLKEFSQEPLPL